MERKIYKIPELSASDKRKLEIRKLYNTIDTLKRNELPSEESPKMVRQLSDPVWMKEMKGAVQELDRKLKADGAKQQLSPSGQEAVTYGAPLRDAARKLYTKNKLAKGGVQLTRAEEKEINETYWTVAGRNKASKELLSKKRAEHKEKIASRPKTGWAAFNKGGTNKKPQMKHGGVHKGKKHAYIAGGSVNNLNMGRKK